MKLTKWGKGTFAAILKERVTEEQAKEIFASNKAIMKVKGSNQEFFVNRDIEHEMFRKNDARYYNKCKAGIVLHNRNEPNCTFDHPCYPIGPANLLRAIELLEWGFDHEYQDQEVWTSGRRWLTVAGVRIHSGTIKNLVDANDVINQIQAGTYVMPDLEFSLSGIEYQGIAYFWCIDFKYPLREEATPHFRRLVRKAFIDAGLRLSGYSPEHVAVINRIEDKLNYQERTRFHGYYNRLTNSYQDEPVVEEMAA